MVGSNSTTRALMTSFLTSFNKEDMEGMEGKEVDSISTLAMEEGDSNNSSSNKR